MKKRNLIIACMSLTCGLLIASVGATVAWFGFGGGLKVDSIDISFVGDKKLDISLDGKNFKEEVDPLGDRNFEPVSSMYSSKWLTVKDTKPVFKRGYSKGNINIDSTYRESMDAKSGFFSQEIYLQSDEFVNVTIDATQPIIIADEVTNKAKAETMVGEYGNDVEKITANLNSIKDSLRVSILDPDPNSYNYWIIDPYKNQETMLAGPLANNSKYYDYYEGSDGLQELIYGEYSNEDKIIYDKAIGVDTPLKDESKPLSCFNASTKGDVMKFNLEKSLENGFTPAIENSLTKQQASDLIKIPLNAFEPKKLVVSIYIEGWDLDNTTETMYGSFIANLKFKIAGRR